MFSRNRGPGGTLPAAVQAEGEDLHAEVELQRRRLQLPLEAHPQCLGLAAALQCVHLGRGPPGDTYRVCNLGLKIGVSHKKTTTA